MYYFCANLFCRLAVPVFPHGKYRLFYADVAIGPVLRGEAVQQAAMTPTVAIAVAGLLRQNFGDLLCNLKSHRDVFV